MCNSKQALTVEDIPDEIWFAIFQKLDYVSLQNTRLTNRYFNHFFRSSFIWLSLCQRYFPKVEVSLDNARQTFLKTYHEGLACFSTNWERSRVGTGLDDPTILANFSEFKNWYNNHCGIDNAMFLQENKIARNFVFRAQDFIRDRLYVPDDCSEYAREVYARYMGPKVYYISELFKLLNNFLPVSWEDFLKPIYAMVHEMVITYKLQDTVSPGEALHDLYTQLANAPCHRLPNLAPASARSDRDFMIRALRVNGMALQYASDELRSDKEVVLFAVKRDVNSFQYADSSLVNEREIAMELVKKTPSLIKKPEFNNFRNDQDFIFEVIRINYNILEYTSEKMRSNRNFMLAALPHCKNALAYISSSLETDKDLFLAGVQYSESNLVRAAKSLKSDAEFMLKAFRLNEESARYFSESLRSDRSFILEAMKYANVSLRLIDHSLRDDKEIVLTGIKYFSTNFLFANERLKSDKDFVLEAVKVRVFSLLYASKSLLSDRSFMLQAMSYNDLAPQFAKGLLKKDKEFYLAGIKKNPYNFKSADDSLKSDKEFVLNLIQLNVSSLRHANATLLSDRSFMLQAISYNGGALEFAANTLKQDKELILDGVKLDPCSFNFADKLLRSDLDFIILAVKANHAVLPYIPQEFRSNANVIQALPKEHTRRFNVLGSSVVQPEPQITNKRFYSDVEPVNTISKCARRLDDSSIETTTASSRSFSVPREHSRDSEADEAPSQMTPGIEGLANEKEVATTSSAMARL